VEKGCRFSVEHLHFFTITVTCSSLVFVTLVYVLSDNSLGINSYHHTFKPFVSCVDRHLLIRTLGFRLIFQASYTLSGLL
jgi:hypothetical protein